MWCFVCLFLVVSTSAIDCLERLISEMTCYASSGTSNPTHSITLLWHCVSGILSVCVCKLSYHRDANRPDIWHCYDCRHHSSFAASSHHVAALCAQVSGTIVIRIPLYGLAPSKQLIIVIVKILLCPLCRPHPGSGVLFHFLAASSKCQLKPCFYLIMFSFAWISQ